MECPTEVRDAIVEILRYGISRIRAHSRNADACFIEADHLHNLPGLISAYDRARLGYYLDAERSCYLNSCRRCEVDPMDYEAFWQRLDEYAATHPE